MVGTGPGQGSWLWTTGGYWDGQVAFRVDGPNAGCMGGALHGVGSPQAEAERLQEDGVLCLWLGKVALDSLIP
jgi:hypothetical protein